MTKMDYTLNNALDAISVFPPGTWENETGPVDWFAVANDDGIIAYFADEVTACRFRLAEVNRILNG